MRLLLLLLAISLLVSAPAAAITATLHSPEIAPGGTVRVSLSGIPKGSRFSLATEGTFPVSPGEQLRFQLTNLTIPFSLSSGEILVTTENTRHVIFKMKKGDITTSLEARPENGTFSKQESRNISVGVYPFMLLEAEPLSPDQPVKARIQLQGETQRIQDMNLSFSPEGIDAGSVAIIITVDDELLMDERIIIGSGESVPAEIRSTDGRVILAGAPGANVIPGNPGPVIDGLIPLGRCYSLVPDDLVFSSPPTLTLLLPSDLPAGSTPFIARKTAGLLQVIPGKIEERSSGAVISTTISEPGEYCLVASVPPEATPPPTESTLPAIICSAAMVFASLISFRYKR